MRQHFWSIVQHELAVEGFGLAPSCEHDISRTIDDTVTTILSQGWIVQRRDVEDDFRRLVRAMIDDARTKGYTECHEDTLGAGLAAATAWPFNLHPTNPWPKGPGQP